MRLPKLIEMLYLFCNNHYITRLYIDYDYTVSKDGDTLKRTVQNCSPLQQN